MKLLHIVEAGKKNLNYLKCLSPINISLLLFSEESFSHYKQLGRSITEKNLDLIILGCTYIT